ncbi:hypothetical protein COB11_03255 [Candidatus Aerophobetes bacterium]|uniref:TVP38/TMEM64 family membrane protein n=1 Tax=Aerophobetes bacterium TaxID=2030807 RepID=A0A2A4YJA6_UNCAE|nr:MAG: hypothetical protein COB11_03255 [Candidatus Aerophobetes bacterium]
MSEEQQEEKKPSGWNTFKKWIPLIVIVIVAFTAYFLGLHKYLTFDNLKRYHDTLTSYAKDYPVLSVVVYMGVYFLGTVFILPEMAILTLLGGMLFPFPLSVVYTVFPATIGACLIFFVAETAVGKYIAQKASGLLKKMQKGFQRDATNYLLFLRLVPLFPFWLVNVAPAIFNVRLWTYTWTTFVGIIPGTAVFCYVGHSLNSIFENNETFSIEAVLSSKVVIALIALGAIIIVPVLIKYIKNRKKKDDD